MNTGFRSGEGKPENPPIRGNVAKLTDKDGVVKEYNYEKTGPLNEQFRHGLIAAIRRELSDPNSKGNLPDISRAVLVLRAHDVPVGAGYDNKKEIARAEEEKAMLFKMAMENEEFAKIAYRLYDKMAADARSRVPAKTKDGRIPGLIDGNTMYPPSEVGAGLAYVVIVMGAYAEPPNEEAKKVLDLVAQKKATEAAAAFDQFVKLEIVERANELPKNETALQHSAEATGNTSGVHLLARAVAKAFTGNGNTLVHNTRVTLVALRNISSTSKYAAEPAEATPPDPKAAVTPDTDAPKPGDPPPTPKPTETPKPGEEKDAKEDAAPGTKAEEADEEKQADERRSRANRRLLRYGAAAVMTLAGAVGAYFAARGVNDVITNKQGEEDSKKTKETWLRRAGVGATLIAVAAAAYLSYRNLASMIDGQDEEGKDDKDNGASKSVFATLGSLGLAWAINQAYQRFGKGGEAGTEGEEVDENSPQWWAFVQKMYEQFFPRVVAEADATEEAQDAGQNRIFDAMDGAIGIVNRIEKFAQQVESDLRRGGDLLKNWIGQDKVDWIQLNVIPLAAQVNFTGEAIEASLRQSREFGDLINQIFQGRPLVPAIIEYASDIFIGNAFQESKDKLQKEIDKRAKEEAEKNKGKEKNKNVPKKKKRVNVRTRT